MRGAVAISFKEECVGRFIADAKTKTTWHISLDGLERSIVLTNQRIYRSITLSVDTQEIKSYISPFGTFSCKWTMDTFTFEISPDASETGWLLYIDGTEFFDIMPGVKISKRD
jgi:hypothetical protein